MNEPETVSLADLGVTDDPGTSWHPRAGSDKWNADGLLPDLNDEETAAHRDKPERYPDSGMVLAAEDSSGSPEGVV